MVIKRPSWRQLRWMLGGSLLLCASVWLWLTVSQLDANGIRFKSITPQKDGLLIKFDSNAQGAAAKEVLGRALPHGYIIALVDEENSATAWLSRLRDAPRRFG